MSTLLALALLVQASTPALDEPAFDPAAEVSRGVALLLELQEGEGRREWTYEGVSRVSEPDGQGEVIPIGYRVGGTALACLALCAAPGYADADQESRRAALERGAERELFPLCAERGVAFTAYSPLAGGWLTGKYRAGEAYPRGSRMTLRPEPYAHLSSERVFQGLAAFESVARERGVSMSALALAWVLAQPHVAAVVIGPRTPAHLEQALAACEVRLTSEEAARLADAF